MTNNAYAQKLTSVTNILSPNLLSYLTVINKLPKNGFKYCIKTGRKLNQISFDEIKDSLQIHSINRTLIICEQLQKSIAVEWVLTDEIGLRRLANKQPIEYFIYAVTHLIPVFISIDKSQSQSQSQSTAHLCLDNNLSTKISANKFLQQISFQQLIHISELTRLILASNRPASMQEMFNTFSLTEICSNLNEFNKFHLILKECYAQIKTGYYDDGIVDARNRQKKQLFVAQRTLIIRNELEKQIADSLEDIEIDKLINPSSQSDELVKLKMEKDAKKLKAGIEKDKVLISRISKLRTTAVNSKQIFNGIKWGKS